MTRSKLVVLTCLTMLAFAGNSILCRMALVNTSIDEASFTSARLLSAAAMLWFLISVNIGTGRLTPGQSRLQGDWISALVLFIYAAALSYAYTKMSTATGALILFGSVQAAMISYGFYRGERFSLWQSVGAALALIGLLVLFLPGLTTPPLFNSLLMTLSGVAWGIYSIRGKSADNPQAATAGNFIRVAPMTILLSIVMFKHISLDPAGLAYAITSGAITSALGYILWYSVLPSLKASHAAIIQLSAPVLASIGGVLLLSEPFGLRLLIASAAIIGGILLVILNKQQPA